MHQVATERKSFLPLRLRSNTIVGSNIIRTTSHPTTPVTPPMPLAVKNEAKSSLIVGNRVLVNGLKNGILRYIGSVKFAEGLFCGVELDEPDGKHDGQVNDIRYFQCKTNHGIFVPHDKVVLASRQRANTSRLKPPTMTRSMTISTAVNNKIEKQIPIKTSSTTVQLPDIIPSASTSIQPILIPETINNSIIIDNHDINTSIENKKSIIQSTEELPETIEADFTDSVSLILHQLQQEQEPFIIQSRPSITISEEGTIDDDESDNESIAESILSEKLQPINNSTKSIQTDLSFDINENLTIMKNNLLDSKSLSYSNKSLTSSTTSLNKFKINPMENLNKQKPNLPTPTSIVKKSTSQRKFSVPTINTSTTSRKPLTNTSIVPRRSSLIPPKTGVLSSTKPVFSLGSQSQLNRSPSSSNSVNSSQSDLTLNQRKSISNTTRVASHSIDLSLNKQSDVLDHQLSIQKFSIQSLESTNEYLKKQYQYLSNQFDLMCILSQYYINQNEKIKQEYELKLSKVRTKTNQLKISIEQVKFSHKNELITLNEQNQNQIYSINEIHKQESVKYQQEIDKLSNEKTELETRCTTLQDQVDRFYEEMSNSEYADPLLRHVATLEKDRTSLETVLEFRNQELTQLRTRINEQVFEREDQLALQKRIDMAENRNQDLVCLLRNWQLNEKAVTVERDQLKEQLAQLERDNRQLTFENETLLYSLRQRSFTISKMNVHTKPRPTSTRAHSSSSMTTTTTEHDRVKRSVSLNCIYNR